MNRIIKLDELKEKTIKQAKLYRDEESGLTVEIELTSGNTICFSLLTKPAVEVTVYTEHGGFTPIHKDIITADPNDER